jgi:hypothetical protein
MARALGRLHGAWYQICRRASRVSSLRIPSCTYFMSLASNTAGLIARSEHNLKEWAVMQSATANDYATRTGLPDEAYKFMASGIEVRSGASAYLQGEHALPLFLPNILCDVDQGHTVKESLEL